VSAGSRAKKRHEPALAGGTGHRTGPDPHLTIVATRDDQGIQKSFGKGALWAGILALLLIALVYGCARASQDDGGGRQGSLFPSVLSTRARA